MNENSQSDQLHKEEKPLEEEPILDLTDEMAGDEGADELMDAIEESAGPDESDAGLEADPLAATVELEDGFDDDFDADPDDDDFVDSLGMEIGSDEEQDQDVAEVETVTEPAATLDVTPEELDAALERVIQKMFYDRIDRILVDVIERRVKKEIDRIKEALLGEASDSE